MQRQSKQNLAANPLTIGIFVISSTMYYIKPTLLSSTTVTIINDSSYHDRSLSLTMTAKQPKICWYMCIVHLNIFLPTKKLYFWSLEKQILRRKDQTAFHLSVKIKVSHQPIINSQNWQKPRPTVRHRSNRNLIDFTSMIPSMSKNPER